MGWTAKKHGAKSARKVGRFTTSMETSRSRVTPAEVLAAVVGVPESARLVKGRAPFASRLYKPTVFRFLTGGEEEEPRSRRNKIRCAGRQLRRHAAVARRLGSGVAAWRRGGAWAACSGIVARGLGARGEAQGRRRRDFWRDTGARGTHPDRARAPH